MEKQREQEDLQLVVEKVEEEVVEKLKRSGEKEEVAKEVEVEEGECLLPPLHPQAPAPAQDRGNQVTAFGIQCLSQQRGESTLK